MNSSVTGIIFGLIIIIGVFFTGIMPTQGINSYQTLASQAHKEYEAKNYLKAGELYEKAYQTSKSKVLLDNSIIAYLSYAFDMANDKKYAEAVKYCEKVLSLSPKDKNAKELLSDVYYSRGSDNFYRGFISKAKEDLNLSLNYSVLPEQAQKAREGLSQLSGMEDKKEKPVPQLPILSVNKSVPELLQLMEMKIYGETHDKLSIIERIRKLEGDVFNKKSEGESIINRVNKLKEAILPEIAMKNINSYQAPCGSDYIQEIIRQSQGTVKIYGNMPIRVYFEEPQAKIYKSFYKKAAEDAFKEWEQASAGKIQFKTVNDPRQCDFKVEWTDNYEDFNWKPKLVAEDTNAEKQREKYAKASTLVKVGSTVLSLAGAFVGVPALGAVGYLGGGVASPLLGYKSMDPNKGPKIVKINTGVTNGLSEEDSKLKIKQITLHQTGHILGIYGHSQDSGDIMYENFSVNKLSQRDINTIKEIYKSLKEPEKQHAKNKTLADYFKK
jgi:tetratricopeptide (TPR) repeat protein